METGKLKKFAQLARQSLMEQVATKLDVVLAADSAARRESPEAVKSLEEAIRQRGKEQVIERVAYTWFNRFCALRFMDVNRYTRVGLVSPAEGQFQPEILAEAKMGHIDEEMVPEKTRQKIFALLDGKAPSRDPQGEAYRLLVVAACNSWNKTMPFLFQRIDDYTELLMPDDLLSGNDILAYTREAMTPDICENVEVIGWLYQFYISEKKDEVFDGLKKNKKITPDNIPAATQLFTPHWIVRYLVENSLGRLWLLNHPSSKLAKQMDYYIKPEQSETNFLRISKPEEIKICDPACGSGHMLTYAFDLLYAIYEEEGYESVEIPEKILTHNLYGVEIDERARELAAFALTMKARAKQRRFFTKGVKPNICVLENVHFDEGELNNYMDFVGRDLFTAPLQTTLRQFEEADNFGSLIRPDITDVDGILKVLVSKNVSGHLFLSMVHQKVLQALCQAKFLNQRYHIVIVNPPYMGSGGMNTRLSAWTKHNFPASKADFFAMFIDRAATLAVTNGIIAMVTMQSWMFLPSFVVLRERVLKDQSILTLIQIGYNSFPELNSKVAQACAFVLSNQSELVPGAYVDLNSAPQSADKSEVFRDQKKLGNIYWVEQSIFKNIPGSPIAYWLSKEMRTPFEELSPRVADYVLPRVGCQTSDNGRFLRYWFEVSSAKSSPWGGLKWFPYFKGGLFRRWYGNRELLINWENSGQEVIQLATDLYRSPTRTVKNQEYYFREGITWSTLSTGLLAFRYMPSGGIFDTKGSACFADAKTTLSRALLFLNSRVAQAYIQISSPTLDYSTSAVGNIPLLPMLTVSPERAEELVALAKDDWDSFETSWNFCDLPILRHRLKWPRLSESFATVRDEWSERVKRMKALEEQNNHEFINLYKLQNEINPEISLADITLTTNPYYRYRPEQNYAKLEEMLLSDTIRELISYATGCMFGRYSLDQPGLIFAGQCEANDDYLNQTDIPSFPVDDDNVIPMLDGEWFTDDVVESFRKFLHVAFGEKHYEENLEFVERALGKNGKRRNIRDYFLKDFYTDHVRRYKKRPIYWLFSSSKGSFNALIYMHRYQPDTVSVVLNNYLREFRNKLSSHKSQLEFVSISTSASQGEKAKALKEIEKLNKMIMELEEYEHDVLYPLAAKRVEIDLDDGVKVNYLKFGAALKKIPGLDVSEK